MMSKRSGTQKGIRWSRVWHFFASMALLLPLGLSSGCEFFFPLEAPVEEVPSDEGIANAYNCECTCKETDGPGVITVNRTVCLPDNLNPVLDPDAAPADAQDLVNDCKERVERNVRQLAKACVTTRLDCDCEAPASLGSRFAAECNVLCPEEELASDCSNFNPETGDKTATNVPGEDPVCFVASSDPPTPVPDPLAAGLFGHTSTCEVEGDVTIARGDDSQTRSATGVVEFTGKPCPDASCSVGMSYRLDHVDTFEFSGFGGFGKAEFTEVLASGATLPAGATVDAAGLGTFATNSSQSSGKGRRGNLACIPHVGCAEISSDRAAYFGTNSEPIDVLVDWEGHECAVSGAVLGSIEDEDTGVDVVLAGTIVNEPPTANAGADTTIECTSAAGAPITLNGTGSTDPEDNIALFVWRQGTRAGTEVGSSAMVNLNQGLGVIQPYFLKVVDTFGQASEDSLMVKVADTTPPTIGAVTATPNTLWPPNHKMVGITVAASAADLCSSAVCKITGVSSNEPVNGLGDGDTSPDWQITGDLTVNLRAERSGTGSGRVYTLTVECSDTAGNSSTKTVTVTVPRNQG